MVEIDSPPRKNLCRGVESRWRSGSLFTLLYSTLLCSTLLYPLRPTSLLYAIRDAVAPLCRTYLCTTHSQSLTRCWRSAT